MLKRAGTTEDPALASAIDPGGKTFAPFVELCYPVHVSIVGGLPMPIKDITGPPRMTGAERAEIRAAITAIFVAGGRPPPNFPPLRSDDGLEPIEPPSGPAPRPLLGGAEATLD
jgi:hypothetical protein